MLAHQEVVDKVDGILAAVFQPETVITDDVTLGQLGSDDSVDLLDLAFRIEQTFKIEGRLLLSSAEEAEIRNNPESTRAVTKKMIVERIEFCLKLKEKKAARVTVTAA
jgi:acyl carrier protein